MNELLKVTGQVNAALVSLAADQPDVADILDKLPQVVVIGSQVSTLRSACLQACSCAGHQMRAYRDCST